MTQILTTPAMRHIRREAWLAEGREDALRFVIECDGDLNQISQKIAETEGLLTDEFMLKGPMKLGAGPRTYRDGYLAALKEALHLIESNPTDKS